MKKTNRRPSKPDRDTLRPEYDFTGAKRGATAARSRQSTNLCLIDPDVLDVFPDGASVNEALRALAVVVRNARWPRAKRRVSGVALERKRR